MKADKIIKNAKIFTSDSKRPLATALAVKDGKFIYVGDEAGLQAPIWACLSCVPPKRKAWTSWRIIFRKIRV